MKASQNIHDKLMGILWQFGQILMILLFPVFQVHGIERPEDLNVLTDIQLHESQTLNSLTIGAGVTATFTSGAPGTGSAPVNSAPGGGAVAGGTRVQNVLRGTSIIFDGKNTITADRLNFNGGTFDIRASGRFTGPISIGPLGATFLVAPNAIFNLSGEITQNLAISTLKKTGLGSIIINGVQTHALSSKFLVSAGSVTLATDAGGALKAYNWQVKVENGAEVKTQSTQHFKSLELTGNAAFQLAPNEKNVLYLNSLTLDMSKGSQLDLSDNSLILSYGNGLSPMPQIETWVKSAYLQNSPAHFWTGPGITSHIAAQDSKKIHSIGLVDSSDGSYCTAHPELSGDCPNKGLFVKYTLVGDTNLDRKVDATDEVAFNYGRSNHSQGWKNGDFNFDNVIDNKDYDLINAAFTDAVNAPLPTVSSCAFGQIWNGVFCQNPPAAPLVAGGVLAPIAVGGPPLVIGGDPNTSLDPDVSKDFVTRSITFPALNSISDYLVSSTNQGMAVGLSNLNSIGVSCFNDKSKVVGNAFKLYISKSSMFKFSEAKFLKLVSSSSASNSFVFFSIQPSVATNSTGLYMARITSDCSATVNLSTLTTDPRDKWLDAAADDHGNVITVHTSQQVDGKNSIKIKVLKSNGAMISSKVITSPFDSNSGVLHLAVHPIENWMILSVQSDDNKIKLAKIEYLNSYNNVDWVDSSAKASGLNSHYLSMAKDGSVALVNAISTNSKVILDVFDNLLVLKSSLILHEKSGVTTDWTSFFNKANIHSLQYNIATLMLPWPKIESETTSTWNKMTTLNLLSLEVGKTYNIPKGNAHTAQIADDGALWTVLGNKLVSGSLRYWQQENISYDIFDPSKSPVKDDGDNLVGNQISVTDWLTKVANYLVDFVRLLLRSIFGLEQNNAELRVHQNSIAIPNSLLEKTKILNLGNRVAGTRFIITVENDGTNDPLFVDNIVIPFGTLDSKPTPTTRIEPGLREAIEIILPTVLGTHTGTLSLRSSDQDQNRFAANFSVNIIADSGPGSDPDIDWGPPPPENPRDEAKDAGDYITFAVNLAPREAASSSLNWNIEPFQDQTPEHLLSFKNGSVEPFVLDSFTIPTGFNVAPWSRYLLEEPANRDNEKIKKVTVLPGDTFEFGIVPGSLAPGNVAGILTMNGRIRNPDPTKADWTKTYTLMLGSNVTETPFAHFASASMDVAQVAGTTTFNLILSRAVNTEIFVPVSVLLPIHDTYLWNLDPSSSNIEDRIRCRADDFVVETENVKVEKRISGANNQDQCLNQWQRSHFFVKFSPNQTSVPVKVSIKNRSAKIDPESIFSSKMQFSIDWTVFRKEGEINDFNLWIAPVQRTLSACELLDFSHPDAGPHIEVDVLDLPQIKNKAAYDIDSYPNPTPGGHQRSDQEQISPLKREVLLDSENRKRPHSYHSYSGDPNPDGAAPVLQSAPFTSSFCLPTRYKKGLYGNKRGDLELFLFPNVLSIDTPIEDIQRLQILSADEDHYYTLFDSHGNANIMSLGFSKYAPVTPPNPPAPPGPTKCFAEDPGGPTKTKYDGVCMWRTLKMFGYPVDPSAYPGEGENDPHNFMHGQFSLLEERVADYIAHLRNPEVRAAAFQAEVATQTAAVVTFGLIHSNKNNQEDLLRKSIEDYIVELSSEMDEEVAKGKLFASVAKDKKSNMLRLMNGIFQAEGEKGEYITRAAETGRRVTITATIVAGAIVLPLATPSMVSGLGAIGLSQISASVAVGSLAAASSGAGGAAGAAVVRASLAARYNGALNKTYFENLSAHFNAGWDKQVDDMESYAIWGAFIGGAAGTFAATLPAVMAKVMKLSSVAMIAAGTRSIVLVIPTVQKLEALAPQLQQALKDRDASKAATIRNDMNSYIESLQSQLSMIAAGFSAAKILKGIQAATTAAKEKEAAKAVAEALLNPRSRNPLRPDALPISKKAVKISGTIPVAVVDDQMQLAIKKSLNLTETNIFITQSGDSILYTIKDIPNKRIINILFAPVAVTDHLQDGYQDAVGYFSPSGKLENLHKLNLAQDALDMIEKEGMIVVKLFSGQTHAERLGVLNHERVHDFFKNTSLTKYLKQTLYPRVMALEAAGKTAEALAVSREMQGGYALEEIMSQSINSSVTGMEDDFYIQVIKIRDLLRNKGYKDNIAGLKKEAKKILDKVTPFMLMYGLKNPEIKAAAVNGIVDMYENKHDNIFELFSNEINYFKAWKD